MEKSILKSKQSTCAYCTIYDHVVVDGFIARKILLTLIFLINNRWQSGYCALKEEELQSIK